MDQIGNFLCYLDGYLKLKQQELKDFNSKENFSKKELVTEWEKTNTLDC